MELLESSALSLVLELLSQLLDAFRLPSTEDLLKDEMERAAIWDLQQQEQGHWEYLLLWIFSLAFAPSEPEPGTAQEMILCALLTLIICVCIYRQVISTLKNSSSLLTPWMKVLDIQHLGRGHYHFWNLLLHSLSFVFLNYFWYLVGTNTE